MFCTWTRVVFTPNERYLLAIQNFSCVLTCCLPDWWNVSSQLQWTAKCSFELKTIKMVPHTLTLWCSYLMPTRKATTQITRLIFFNAYLPNVPVPHSRFGAYNICKKLCLAEIQRASISQVHIQKKIPSDVQHKLWTMQLFSFDPSKVHRTCSISDFQWP